MVIARLDVDRVNAVWVLAEVEAEDLLVPVCAVVCVRWCVCV